jgi:hypothetical protein
MSSSASTIASKAFFIRSSLAIFVSFVQIAISFYPYI